VRSGKENSLEASAAIEGIVSSPDIFAEDERWWTEACRGVDTIIHAAWYAEPGVYLQSPKNHACLAGTLRLAQAAIAARVRRFAGVGTCFEYDLAAGRLAVDTPLKPTTVYAQAKADTFAALLQLLPQHGVGFVWCRMFYLFGEGEDERRLVPYLRAKLKAGEPAELSGGTQIRDFLDVREAGRMIVDAALGTAQGPVNICSGAGVTVRALAEQIADEYGRRDLLRFGARPDNLVDPPVVIGVRAAR
jgi:nucleoside-diphosphate-sugar epimerase